MRWRNVFSKMTLMQRVKFFFHYLLNPTHGKAYTHDGDVLTKVDCPNCGKVFYARFDSR